MVKNKKKRLGVYPGTFDPVTNGHLSLIERASHLFDELVVAVSANAGQTTLFDHRERIGLLEGSVTSRDFAGKVRVVGFDGLLAKLASDLNASAIVRGLRAVSDFEFEFQMALMNRKLARDVETVFLMPSLSWVYLSSTLVKDVASHSGEIKDLVPAGVKRAMKKKLSRSNRPR